MCYNCLIKQLQQNSINVQSIPGQSSAYTAGPSVAFATGCCSLPSHPVCMSQCPCYCCSLLFFCRTVCSCSGDVSMWLVQHCTAAVNSSTMWFHQQLTGRHSCTRIATTASDMSAMYSATSSAQLSAGGNNERKDGIQRVGGLLAGTDRLNSSDLSL